MLSLKLFVADNTNWLSMPDKMQAIKEWFAPVVDLEIELFDTFFDDVPFEEYAPFQYGVERKWYEERVVPIAKAERADICLFALDKEDWKGKGADGWRSSTTTPVMLQAGCGENDHIYLPYNGGDYGEMFFMIARHEILHALFLYTGQVDITHIYPHDLDHVRDSLRFERYSLMRKVRDLMRKLLTLLSRQNKL